MRKTISYIIGRDLIRMNNDAVYYKRNKSMTQSTLRALVKHNGPDTKYPITFSMIHNDNEIRMEVILCIDKNKEPMKAWIDFDIKFDRLIKTTVANV